MNLSTIKANLEKNRFTVTSFETAAQAAAYLEESVKGETIGFGGSMTLNDMGLYEKLGKQNQVVWHWRSEGAQAKDRFPEFTAYLTSVNAAAETGELVNIDGGGNRVSASVYGPKTVIFVVGANKITPDLPSAVERARNVASPLNAKRLERKTPCVKDLKCHDCASPERICGVVSIHLRPMLGCKRTEVVLINESLGY